jgi:hypothetical protein
MEKIATRSQKGMAGVREYLKSQERKAFKEKTENGITGVTWEEVTRRVFDDVIALQDRASFTTTAGKIYGGVVKRLYKIEKIRSVYEGWQYVALKLTREVCGDESIIRFGNLKNGTWLIRDKSAEYVLEQKLREQLEILTGRTFK